MTEKSCTPLCQQLMKEATRLTRIGKLQAATAAIQSLFRSRVPEPPAPAQTQPPGPSSAPVQPFEHPSLPEVERGPVPPGSFIDGSFALSGAHRDYKLYIPSGSRTPPAAAGRDAARLHPESR